MSGIESALPSFFTIYTPSSIASGGILKFVGQTVSLLYIALKSFAPVRSASEKFAPVRSASEKFANVRSASEKFALERFAFERSAPVSFAPGLGDGHTI